MSDFVKINFEIDATWTLFLDRDGVINRRLIGDYVKNVAEFEFLNTALSSIAYFTKIFDKIIVVTNQQGIGKSLMTTEQLTNIHEYMCAKISAYSGRIDAVYHAPQLAEANSIDRKPNPGMALQAQQDFPQIVFKKSIIIGDSVSDMEFGKRLGMKTVFIGTIADLEGYEVDAVCADLGEFVDILRRKDKA